MTRASEHRELKEKYANCGLNLYLADLPNLPTRNPIPLIRRIMDMIQYKITKNTCHLCTVNIHCPFAYDAYNTYGDCILEK